MVRKVDKQLGVLIGVENFSTSRFGITCHYCNKLFRCNVFTTVVNFKSSIQILAIRMVENFAGERVLTVICDIIIHHGDDVVGRNSVSNQNMVCVGDVSLMSVVPVAV